MMRNKSSYVKYSNPKRVWNRTLKRAKFPVYHLRSANVYRATNRKFTNKVKNFLRRATANHPQRLPYPMPGKWQAKWKKLGGKTTFFKR